ncbi:MAG TPA: response regulator [Candidatus Cybelea sp.]|nr:response regulator [Candidatus Cybelea sp.]
MYLRPAQSWGPRILVVDDDPQILIKIERILRMNGFLSVAAADGKAARALLAAQAVDLVLTDIFMPQCDGFELIAAIRTMEQPIPVIAMSGCESWTGLDFLDAANDLGASAVLRKPFAASLLLQLIGELLPHSDANAAAAPRSTPRTAIHTLRPIG